MDFIRKVDERAGIGDRFEAEKTSAVVLQALCDRLSGKEANDLLAQLPAMFKELVVVSPSLGFWAAGNWSRSVVLLVAWVGATAMFRGVAMITFGFKLRALQEQVVETETAAARERQRRRRPVESYGS